MNPSKQRLIERWQNLQQPNISTLKCPVCFYNDSINKYKVYKANDLFHAGQLIRYKCPNCDLIFGDLRFLNLSLEEIGNDYADLYSYYSEGDVSDFWISCFDTLSYFNDKSKKYLDFACGKWSKLITKMRDKQYNLIGYDKYVISDNYYIKSKINDNDKFDVIYTTNYVEHLIDPYSNFKELRDLLNNNGVLIMLSSSFNYCNIDTHYHTLFFSDKSLDILCKNLNMEIIETQHFYYHSEDVVCKVFKKL
jgi:hypothetical protein